MFSKLRALSMTLLLIALLTAQLIEALPQYQANEFPTEGWGKTHSHRHDDHHHHHHHHHVDRHHHGHGSYRGYDGSEDETQRIGAPSGAGFQHTATDSSGSGFRGTDNEGQQPDAFYNAQQTEGGFRGNVFVGQQSDGGFRGHNYRPVGYGNSGFRDNHRSGYDGGFRSDYDGGFRSRYPGGFRSDYGGGLRSDYPGGFRSGSAGGFRSQQYPGNEPQSSEPGFVSGNSLDSNEMATGSAANPLQPRPGVNPYNPTDFEQQSNVQNAFPIQPRPNPSDLPTFQISGSDSNPLQPRPGVGTHYPTLYQEPETFQPRPQTVDSSDFNLQSLESGNNPLQPRPGVGLVIQGTVQQPHNEAAGSSIQPRPTETIRSPKPESPNVLQPIPAGSRPTEPNDGPQPLGDGDVGSTIQPRPDSAGHFESRYSKLTDHSPAHTEEDASGIVADNISTMFKTTDYKPDTAYHGSREPKAETVGADGISIEGRNLFNTQQQCGAGTDLRGGRCRPSA